MPWASRALRIASALACCSPLFSFSNRLIETNEIPEASPNSLTEIFSALLAILTCSGVICLTLLSFCITLLLIAPYPLSIYNTVTETANGVSVMEQAINRTEIFSFAWTLARQDLFSRRLPVTELRNVFPDALRRAWAEMKRRAIIAAESAKQVLRASADLLAEIQNLENRTTLGHEGLARLSNLRCAYHASKEREAEEQAAAEMEAKRKMIAAAKGRFVSVTFIKKDGSERVMRVQPATLKYHLKGDSASESARKAVQTRAERHPHLMPVWDADKAAARSVNLSTISRIAVDGSVHEYAIH